MSSTNKTKNLKLNNWISNDCPLRVDFNKDNEIIDETLTSHFNDFNLHIKENERLIWNSPYFINSYIGSGESERNIVLNCDFEPKMIILFATALPTVTVDIENKIDKFNFAICTQGGGTLGAVLSGKTLTVKQDSSPQFKRAASCLNIKSQLYYFIAFR